MRQVLFKTVHGSHLYGLAHAGSDEDYFVVIAKESSHRRKRYATQNIVNGVDTTTVDLGTFLVGCQKGVPQYLEAMMSQVPEVDLIAPLRAGFVASSGVYDTYLRTMKSLALQDTFKEKRHALRLAINMRDLRLSGRFNPRLGPHAVAAATAMAEHCDGEFVYETAKRIAWSM